MLLHREHLIIQDHLNACFRLISTLLVAKYIHNFGRKTMYFISAATTIIFQVLFGVIDLLDLGYTWKIFPLIVICGQVSFPQILGRIWMTVRKKLVIDVDH